MFTTFPGFPTGPRCYLKTFLHHAYILVVFSQCLSRLLELRVDVFDGFGFPGRHRLEAGCGGHGAGGAAVPRLALARATAQLLQADADVFVQEPEAVGEEASDVGDTEEGERDAYESVEHGHQAAHLGLRRDVSVT